MSDVVGTIARAVDFIEDNLTSRITLMEIAENSWLSPFHFHRLFHAWTGYSVSEYVRLRRLSEAALKLIHTKERIIEIALEYGFGSQASFTRAFRRQYDTTPGRFRKKGTIPFSFEKTDKQRINNSS